MSDYKIGILTIGYNRANNLLRLLNSINAATFPTDDVDLLISIDNSGTKDVENAANSFKWLHGRKKIYTYPERLGLRKHILKCGDFLDFYDALVVLEDDLVVAPSFYMYVLMTVNKYIENNNIAGISLYTHLWNYNAGLPFTPCPSMYDVYFLQMAQSWGQVWLKSQWKDFKRWYEENKEFDRADDFPDFMTNWTESWLKYHNKYCVTQNKYFVYPYNSYTTCFSEAGEHSVVSVSNFQVPMMFGNIETLRLPDFNSKDAIKYDIFYERQGLEKFFRLHDGELTVDIYGKKIRQVKNRKYLLSSRVLPYKVIKTFALQMRPQEQNNIYDVQGNDIFLYDTEIEASKSQGNDEENHYIYYHRIYGNTRLLLKTCFKLIIEDVHIAIIQKRKKYKK